MLARWVVLSIAIGAAMLAAACGDDRDADALPPPDDARSGGDGTHFDTSRDALSKPLANLAGSRRDDFFLGNSIFKRGWITAPASVSDFDGLGPLFNAGNCSACHFNDGRGRPPIEADEELVSMLIRLSIAGTNEHGGVVPEPVYGDQLQQGAILGVPKEGAPRVTYVEQPGAYADGEAYALRIPTYTIENLGYGSLAPGVMLSPRVAPALTGMGFLEAIPEAAILANADPEDRDGDGISGRPNHVWDVARQRTVLGRLGWKANQPGIRQQDAGAFLGDMGITSTLFATENCSAAQAECTASQTGPGPQLREDFRAQIDYYTFTLGVPGRRDVASETVRRGRQLFDRARCGACHTPTFTTQDFPEFPELAYQTIHPFSDLLLHDMGPDLADNRPDFEATGTEWRTPPLWGIGLVERVNKHTFLMHDGRARGFAEAILWHGGEAVASRAAFVAMSQPDRAALVAFLGSL